MNKLLALCLMSSVLVAVDYGYSGSSCSVVTLVGGIIKTQHLDKEKKYPRKDCPVCKGSGKYLSGDKISMVDCGYCEPEKKSSEELQITHPPVVLKPDIRTRVIRK